MRSASKFTFDTEFRGPSDVVSETARGRQKKTMTVEEIDAMRAEAEAKGADTATARAAETVDHAATALTTALRAALDQSHGEIEALRAEAAQLALAAAKKLAPAALAAAPAGEVEQALREAMHQAIGEPRITLRAAPQVITALEPRITEITHAEGYEGRVILAADPAIANADCRIEWRGGGAERSEATIEAALDALIARRFSHTPDASKG